jgi:anti-anti-sigma regulatory factor
MQRTGTAHLHTGELESATEAAVLFAANFVDAAMDLLRAETERSMERAEIGPWLMLLEVYHLTGRRSEFDALAARYRRAFEVSTPPSWGLPAPVSAPSMISLDGVIASNRDLARLVDHASTCRTVAIDMSGVQRIDFAFASSFSELLRTFHSEGKRVILANISEINATLLETLGANHHLVLLRRKIAPNASVSATEVHADPRGLLPLAARPAPAVHGVSA